MWLSEIVSELCFVIRYCCFSAAAAATPLFDSLISVWHRMCAHPFTIHAIFVVLLTLICEQQLHLLLTQSHTPYSIHTGIPEKNHTMYTVQCTMYIKIPPMSFILYMLPRSAVKIRCQNVFFTKIAWICFLFIFPCQPLAKSLYSIHRSLSCSRFILHLLKIITIHWSFNSAIFNACDLCPFTISFCHMLCKNLNNKPYIFSAVVGDCPRIFDSVCLFVTVCSKCASQFVNVPQNPTDKSIFSMYLLLYTKQFRSLS